MYLIQNIYWQQWNHWLRMGNPNSKVDVTNINSVSNYRIWYKVRNLTLICQKIAFKAVKFHINNCILDSVRKRTWFYYTKIPKNLSKSSRIQWFTRSFFLSWDQFWYVYFTNLWLNIGRRCEKIRLWWRKLWKSWMHKTLCKLWKL